MIHKTILYILGKSIPNDQGNFAKWLYGTMPTCKEGNGLQCAANQYSVASPGSGKTSLSLEKYILRIYK